MNPPTKSRCEKYFLFLLPALTVIFFSEPIFYKVTFYFRDLLHHYYPYKLFFIEEINSGRLPLWYPYVYKGTPFFADPSMSVFYPLNVIFFLLPFQTAFNYLIISHYFLLGLFSYVFFRSIRISRFSSLFSSIVMMFSGYILFLHSQLNFLQSAIWIPLILSFYIKSLDSGKNRLKWLALTSITISIQLFGGNPQDVLISIIFMLAIAAGRIISKKDKKYSLMIIKYFIIIGVLSLGLSSIQLFPSIELAAHTSRGAGLLFEDAVLWSFHPLRLVEFLLPFPFGKIVSDSTYYGQFLVNNIQNLPWTLNVYIGLLPLFFIIIGLFSKRKNVNLYIYLLFFFLFLSFGKYTPFYYICFKVIPSLSVFRYPEKFILAVTFSLTILSAFGCDYFFKYFNLVKRASLKATYRDILKRAGTLYRLIERSAWAIIIIASSVYIIFLTNDRILISWYDKLFEMKNINMSSLVASNVLKEGLLHFILFGFLSLFLITAFKKGLLNISIFKTLLILILFIDILSVNKNLLYYTSYYMYDSVPQIVKDIKKLSKDKDRFRIYRASMNYNDEYREDKRLLTRYEKQRLWEKNSLKKDMANLYHLSYFDGSETLEITDYVDFFREMKKYPDKMLSLLNVKYLITTNDDSFYTNKSKYRTAKVYENDNLRLIENKDYFSRTFIVDQALNFNNKKDVLRTISQKDFDFKNIVALESGVERLKGVVLSGEDKGQSEIVDYESNYVRINVTAKKDSYLVLSDTYYPGWKGYVDGVEEPVLKANYIMRALFVKTGTHIVEFKYEPASFKAGLVVSLLTFLLLITLLYHRRNTRD